jgi:Ca-activated chloride channel homolog
MHVCRPEVLVLPRLPIAAAFGLLAVGIAPGAAQEAVSTVNPSTIIVFDGSGSMWNRFEGEKVAKFVTAASAIKNQLAKQKPETRVGVAAFGHRRQGDCNDVQIVFPPDALSANTERIGTFLDKINPKGKGPLTAALREAAKALPKDTGPKSLILMHDDADNCTADACAALADIQAAAPGVVIHVVGLAVKGDDAQKYQCLTKATGGRFIDAQTAAGAVAGVEEVFGALAVGKAPAAPPPVAAIRPVTARPAVTEPAAAVAPQPGARPAVRSDGQPGVRLATVLIAGQAPTGRPVHWTVRAATAATTDRPAYVGVGQDLIVPLPAGAYMIDVRDGGITPPTSKITVGAQGVVPLDVVLDAGLIRANVPADVPPTMALQIFEPGPDGALGKAFGVFAAHELRDGMAVPAGKWVFRVGDGAARIERTVDVKAGTALDLGAPWPFGRVQITIAGASTTARQPVVVIAYEDDPDAPRGRREIARSSSRTPDLVLPAGAYALVARQGSVEVRDRVAVQGGELIKRTMTLAGARITLTSRFPGNIQAPPDEPVAYRIERLDVVPTEVFASNRQMAELDLPAGRYRIEARHGLVNARAAREITLVPGQAAAVVIEQQAAAIRFNGPPGATGDHLWEILDMTSHPLWSTVQTSPRAILQAGRYIVRLDIRDKRIERTIEVKPGQVGTVDIRD